MRKPCLTPFWFAFLWGAAAALRQIKNGGRPDPGAI